MKNRFDSKNITNVQLEEAFATQLASGKVVLIHTEETKNPEWLSCFFAQKRNVASRGSAPSAGLSSIAKALKGFDATSNNYIVRHIENLNVKALADLGIVVGSTLDAIIGVEDKNVPMTPNQTPHTSKDGEIRLSAGKPVYTHTTLTTAAEYAGDSVMKFDYTPVVKTEVASEFAKKTAKL